MKPLSLGLSSASLWLMLSCLTSAFAQTPATALSGEGGQTSGGGEVDIGPEYLKIAGQLARGLEARSRTAKSPELLDVSRRISTLLAQGIQILPTNQPLVWKDPESDDAGTLVDALTIIGKRKTYVYAPNWLRRSCQKKYLLTLHEFLVHEKIEPSLTLHKSTALWEELQASKKAGVIDTDFSCEERTLPAGHGDFIVAVVTSKTGERISMECVDSDTDARCTTYQFFYTPRQQDIKTPIGGKVYSVQELASLSVVDWHAEKWRHIPLFVIEDVRLTLSYASSRGMGMGIQFDLYFNGFKKLAERMKSRKAQAILDSMTEVEAVEDSPTRAYTQYSSSNGAFQTLLQYLSHEASVDFNSFWKLNDGLRITEKELSSRKCIRYGSRTEVCAVVDVRKDGQGFFLSKPQSNGVGFRAGARKQFRYLCDKFSDLIGVDARDPSVRSYTNSQSFRQWSNPYRAERMEAKGLQEQYGTQVGNHFSRVIGTIECSK